MAAKKKKTDPHLELRQAYQALGALLEFVDNNRGQVEAAPRKYGRLASEASKQFAKAEPVLKRVKSDAIFLMRADGYTWEDILDRETGMDVNRARGYQLLKGGGHDSLYAQDERHRMGATE